MELKIKVGDKTKEKGGDKTKSLWWAKKQIKWATWKKMGPPSVPYKCVESKFMTFILHIVWPPTLIEININMNWDQGALAKATTKSPLAYETPTESKPHKSWPHNPRLQIKQAKTTLWKELANATLVPINKKAI